MGYLRKNRCPKCGGNMFLYNDFDGWYEQCLQCAHIKYLDVIYDNKQKVGKVTASETSQVTAN